MLYEFKIINKTSQYGGEKMTRWRIISDIVLLALIGESFYHNKDFGGVTVVLVFLLFSIIFYGISILLERYLKKCLLEKTSNSPIRNITLRIISIAFGGLFGLTAFHITCKAVVEGYKNSFTDSKFLIMVLLLFIILVVFELCFCIYYHFKEPIVTKKETKQ